MAIASTCVDHRKYLHWHLQVLSFFLPTFVRDNDRIDDDVRMKCDIEKSHTI